MPLSLERKIAAVFVAGIIVLAIIGGAAWLSLSRFETEFQRVDHTHQVLSGLEQILVDALNIQTGSRGYALSGDPRFLEPFDQGVESIRASVARVRTLTNDSAHQQAALARLDPMIAHLIALMLQRNEALLRGDSAAAEDMSILHGGKETMDRIRTLIEEMSRHETVLLSDRSATLQRAASRTRGILLLAVAVALVLAAMAGTGLQRELAARRRTDAALQRSRAVFETLFEQATDAFVVVDKAGVIRRVNRRTEDLFGYARGELVGQPVELLMPGRFHAAHVGHRAAFVTEPKFRAMGAGLELFAKRKDGVEFPVDIMLSPLVTDEGRVVLAAVRDITERKAAALAQQQHREELEAANEQLEAFNYSVSHDLRAPLRHMMGFASILQEHAGPNLDDEGRRYLDVISRSADKMGRLIDDLLAFSRLGRAPLNVEPVDTDAMVRLMTRDGSIDAAPGTEWRIAPLPPVVADPALLQQVWLNLLGNAAKYSAKSTPPIIEITATANAAGREVEFRVRDNGVGFDPRHAEKLFGVFTRLHTEAEFSGTGVGLALVKRIVMRHGGRVGGSGEAGRGATFWFTLPATAATPRA